MFQVLFFIACLLIPYLGFSQSNAPLSQVDLLVSAYPMPPLTPLPATGNPLPPLDKRQAIPIMPPKNRILTPYHRLPFSYSRFKRAYWNLRQASLIHYSWLQPWNNPSPVALPQTTHDGWIIDRLLYIKPDPYYNRRYKNAFHHPDNSVLALQTERIKPGSVYYLEHPQIGPFNLHSSTYVASYEHFS